MVVDSFRKASSIADCTNVLANVARSVIIFNKKKEMISNDCLENLRDLISFLEIMD